MPNLTVVMDIGQFSSKVGFSGEDNPSMVFFTIVGKPKYHDFEGEFTKQKQELYVGDEIQSLGLYKIYRPIENGRITDWNYFERIMGKSRDWLPFDNRNRGRDLQYFPVLLKGNLWCSNSVL